MAAQRPMRTGRHIAAWIAILTIAVQALLPGFARPFPAAVLDTSICHSDASAADNQGSPAAPQHDCCDQCILSSSVPIATAPDVPTLLTPTPARSNVLSSVFSRERLEAQVPGANLARGPPDLA
jgi:hypothetical protein